VLRVSDGHWHFIRTQCPGDSIAGDRLRRTPIPAREVLEALRWVPTTGAQWRKLPQDDAEYPTLHRRLRQSRRDAVVRAAPADLADALREDAAVDPSERDIDATFASAKNGPEQA
jgi:transposase